MQTSYDILHEKGVEGMAQAVRRSRPLTLPLDEQIETVQLVDASPAAAEVVTVTIVDDETAESFSFDFTTTGTLADDLDDAVVAFGIHDQLPLMFELDEDGVDELTFTARHADRTYTFSAAVDTGSMTFVLATSQAAGGQGLEFGRMVARGAGDRTFAAVGAATASGDLQGILFRTDGNHFRLTDGDTAASVDRCAPGKTYAIMEEGRFLAKVEDSVAPGGAVHMRRSGTGRLGGLRGAPAGGQQLITATPAAVDLAGYGFSFGYLGRHYSARYFGDGTTTVAVACDGLVASLGTIAGLTITDGTTEVTVETAAGTELDYFTADLQQDDTPADSVGLVETNPADVDTVDVSAFASFEETGAADDLVWVKVDMGAQ